MSRIVRKSRRRMLRAAEKAALLTALLWTFTSLGLAQSYPTLRMDSLSGQRELAYDEIGAQSGIYMHGSLRSVAGVLPDDTAATFDGVRQYLRVPTRDSIVGAFGRRLGCCSIEFWYRSTADNRGRCVLGSINDGANTALQIEVDRATGRLMLLLRSDGGPQHLMRVLMSPQFSVAVSDGEFHHLVWVVDDASTGKVRVYFDGMEDREATVTGTSSGTFTEFRHDLAIGASNVRGRVDQFVAATLDEVALYTRSLSAAEVQRHFTQATMNASSYASVIQNDKAVAYWRLGEHSPQNLHLVLDSRNVARVKNAVLRVGKPAKHPKNPLFGEEHSWEVMFNNLYPNVIFDAEAGLYKVWYSMFVVDSAYAETSPADRKPGTYMQRVGVRRDGLGYAVSRDGIHWEKPMLREVTWKGAPSNLVARDVHGAGVLLDPAERDPARRYKMFCRGSSMTVRFSSDGIRWGAYIPCPEIHAAGDTHNNTVWSSELQRYVGFTRLWQGPTRVVGRTESRDYVHWTKATEVLRGERLFDVYSMPVIQYGNIYIGLPAVFDEQSDRVHTELAWSPDTIQWYRLDAGRPLIPNAEEKGAYDWGTVYASRPIVTQDGIRIYYGGCNSGHFDWRDGFLCLAKLRPDGFAGFEPTNSETAAIVETPPLPFSSRLRMTADAQGGSITVLVVDAKGSVLATSEPISADVTDEPVRWPEAVDLVELAGRQLSLRFEIRRARLYSFLR